MSAVGETQALRMEAVLRACDVAGSPGSPAEQAALSNILLGLIPPAESHAATRLAEHLAKAAWAPRPACLWLAHQSIAIAHPLIARSTTLEDADLVELVRGPSSEHRVEVARRRPLSSTVSAAVIDAGDVVATGVLLANAFAELTPAQLDRVVALAADEPGLRAAVVRRRELDLAQAARLAPSLAPPLRRRLVDRFGEGALDRARLEVAPESDAAQWVEKLAESGHLTPASSLAMLRGGRTPAFEAALARMSGAPREIVSAALRAPATELPGLLRAAGIDPAAAAFLESTTALLA